MGYRYLGNKTRLVDWLMESISQILSPGTRVADPMCGTAAVSEALAIGGFTVTASDELTFPTLHAQVRLLTSSEPAFSAVGGYESALGQLNNVEPRKGLFFREYSADGTPENGSRPRKYFTGENAQLVDAIRHKIKVWYASGCLTERERTLLLHDLVLAVNEVANIAGTYGYYRSKWSNSSLRRIRLTASHFRNVGQEHRVLQGRVEDIAGDLDADACYLDPPYTKRQYAGNYHILETIALEDDPSPVGEGGLRDWYGQYSNFCSRRFVEAAFSEVVKRLEVEHVFVSYSEDGLLSASALQDILASRGRVTRFDLPISRFVSNGGGRGGLVSEFLFHLSVRR